MEKIRRKGAKLLRQCSQMTYKGPILKKSCMNILYPCVMQKHAPCKIVTQWDRYPNKCPQYLSNAGNTENFHLLKTST